MLSPEERDALARRAANLRTEISDLTAERDAARANNALSADDARLIAEVESLEAMRDKAAEERNEAVGVADAIKLMRESLEGAGVVEPAPAPSPVEATAPDAESANKTPKGGSR